jgi:hypothetical protein
MERYLCVLRVNFKFHRSSQLVNFGVIKDIILNEERNVVVHTEKEIQRKKRNGFVSIIGKPEDKMYRIPFH